VLVYVQLKGVAIPQLVECLSGNTSLSETLFLAQSAQCATVDHFVKRSCCVMATEYRRGLAASQSQGVLR